MHIQKLNINFFRNIEQNSLDLHPRFNAFYGENGSGKTSILEAIYYLAMAKSFRSNYSRYIIRDGKSALTVYSELLKEEEAGVISPFTLGASKGRQGDVTLKHQGEIVSSQGEWVKLLPVLICNHDTYQLLDAGPKVRRQFIDWGVFHVKHHFYPHWQVLQKALKQRNSALRAELPREDIRVWNAPLVEASLAINELRKAYLIEFKEFFQCYLDAFITLDRLSIEFSSGWPEESDYAALLDDSLYRDRQYGYTRYGPHRADLKFLVGGKPANEVLSRGQQKVFVLALKLAQGEMLRQVNKPCLYLIDDLPSELDTDKQARVIQALADMASQVFVTGIDKETLENLFVESGRDYAMFHVNQGVATKV